MTYTKMLETKRLMSEETGGFIYLMENGDIYLEMTDNGDVITSSLTVCVKGAAIGELTHWSNLAEGLDKVFLRRNNPITMREMRNPEVKDDGAKEFEALRDWMERSSYETIFNCPHFNHDHQEVAFQIPVKDVTK